ncbi:hypothetical protein GCM10023258_24930 [Terrabacter aeriphilus]|uniref:Peptidase YpeB-like protein n=1 Tax=Terrabacter aeriphilus TaxID=515662 RepID=A0ABP9JEH2_9MICO
MKKKTITLAGAGIVAASALALGGAALASADESASTGPASTGRYAQLGEGLGGGPGGQRSPEASGGADPSQPMRSDEKLLTGDTAAKVTAAARAKEPTATVERVETDSDGVYEAHLVRADGTHVTVQVDASFTVTAVQEGGPGGPGGPGGRGDHDGDGPHGQGGPQGESPTSPTSPTGTATSSGSATT